MYATKLSVMWGRDEGFRSGQTSTSLGQAGHKPLSNTGTLLEASVVAWLCSGDNLMESPSSAHLSVEKDEQRTPALNSKCSLNSCSSTLHWTTVFIYSNNFQYNLFRENEGIIYITVLHLSNLCPILGHRISKFQTIWSHSVKFLTKFRLLQMPILEHAPPLPHFSNFTVWSSFSCGELTAIVVLICSGTNPNHLLKSVSTLKVQSTFQPYPLHSAFDVVDCVLPFCIQFRPSAPNITNLSFVTL